MTLNSQDIIAVILFIISIISGFTLSKSDKPLNKIILAVHKLVSLGAIIFIGIFLFASLESVEYSFQKGFLISLSALSLLVLLVTGSFLSVEKKFPDYILIIHRISTVLVILFTTGIVIV